MDRQGGLQVAGEDLQAADRERLQQDGRARIRPRLIEPGRLQLGKHGRLDPGILDRVPSVR